MNKTLGDEIVAARKALTKLGIVEDSGLRRPDRQGVMQVVWRISSLGYLVQEYERQGLTFKQALAKARSSRVQ